jgi:hypothetical protein
LNAATGPHARVSGDARAPRDIESGGNPYFVGEERVEMVCDGMRPPHQAPHEDRRIGAHGDMRGRKIMNHTTREKYRREHQIKCQRGRANAVAASQITSILL